MKNKYLANAFLTALAEKLFGATLTNRNRNPIKWVILFNVKLAMKDDSFFLPDSYDTGPKGTVKKYFYKNDYDDPEFQSFFDAIPNSETFCDDSKIILAIYKINRKLACQCAVLLTANVKENRLQKINELLQSFGVEKEIIKNKTVSYCNVGESYHETVIQSGHKFFIQSIGDFEES